MDTTKNKKYFFRMVLICFVIMSASIVLVGCFDKTTQDGANGDKDTEIQIVWQKVEVLEVNTVSPSSNVTYSNVYYKFQDDKLYVTFRNPENFDGTEEMNIFYEKYIVYLRITPIEE